MAAERDKPSVLIVDDVEANLITLEALLADLDCELIRASDGNQALRELLKREYAVVLLDVQMPGMDGYEVAKYARDNPTTRDIPIVFLTATHYSEESMLRGYGTGAIDFLLKPINAEVLRAKVRVFVELYLSRRKLADEVRAHQKTLAALTSTNEALRHFTHAASHDLKAPLRAMRGFLAALSDASAPSLSDAARDYLQRSLKAAQRMDALLDSLLSYVRLQRPIARVQVAFDTLLQQVQADLAPELAAAGASVTAGELPVVHGDAGRLYQLLLNLLSNAIKFRRADVPLRLRVSAEPLSREFRFCVEDNGIGIDAKHRETIFAAFSRLHTQDKYEGSGLGLAICQQIVEQHGGRIWVESEPGAGCRFYFTLSQTERRSDG